MTEDALKTDDISKVVEKEEKNPTTEATKKRPGNELGLTLIAYCIYPEPKRREL